jgi:hypothetical protein
MAITDNNVYATSTRGLPGKNLPFSRGPIHVDQYGNVVVQQIGEGRYTLADQATYYIAHNTTNDASSTILGHAAPHLADADATMTKALVFMQMNPASGLRAYLDYIELEVVTAPTGGSVDNWAAQLDTGKTRVTTAGTALTSVNPNMQVSTVPDLAPQAGAIVVGAENTGVRNLGFGQTRGGVAIIGDRYQWRFGDEPSPGDNVVSAAASRHLINMPPVILGASDMFLLALYAASDDQTVAAVYKVRMGWWEY